MSILIQIGGKLADNVDQDMLSAATKEFVERIQTYPGYERAVQLLNPETRHFQGLIYFNTDEAAQDFMEARGFEEFGLFEKLAGESELTLARLLVVDQAMGKR